MTHLPAARTTVAPAGTWVLPAGPTAVMRSPSTMMVALRSVASGPLLPGCTTVAPTIAVVRSRLIMRPRMLRPAGDVERGYVTGRTAAGSLTYRRACTAGPAWYRHWAR